MGMIEGSGEQRVAVDGLNLEASVIVATGSMSAADADKARGVGQIAMAEPANATAYLEVGGVRVAEGTIGRKRGKAAFIVTRMFESSNEEH